MVQIDFDAGTEEDGDESEVVCNDARKEEGEWNRRLLFSIGKKIVYGLMKVKELLSGDARKRTRNTTRVEYLGEKYTRQSTKELYV